MTRRAPKPSPAVTMPPALTRDEAIRVASLQAALAMPLIGTSPEAAVLQARTFEKYIRGE